mgnify:CR=1 FL=1
MLATEIILSNDTRYESSLLMQGKESNNNTQGINEKLISHQQFRTSLVHDMLIFTKQVQYAHPIPSLSTDA